MTHTKTSSLAFISLQTCLLNFQLNQKSRGDDCPPASYAYALIQVSICCTSLTSSTMANGVTIFTHVFPGAIAKV